MSLDLSRTLGLSRHADLKTRADGSVLVLPERAIRLGGSGAEILRLVAENRTVGFVLNAMRDRYPNSSDTSDTSDTSTVAAEVLAFLEEMLDRGAIVDLDECCRRNA